MLWSVPLALSLIVLPGVLAAQTPAAPAPSIDWSSDPLTGFQTSLKDQKGPEMPSKPADWGKARVDSPSSRGEGDALKACSVAENPSLRDRFNNTRGYYPQQPVPTKPFQNYTPPTTRYYTTPGGVFIEPPNSGSGYRTIVGPGGTYVLPPTRSSNYDIIIGPNGGQRIILPAQRRNYQLTTPPGLRAPFPR